MRVLDADSKGVRVEMDEGTVTARPTGAPPLDVLSKGRSVRASDADFTVWLADKENCPHCPRGQLKVSESQSRGLVAGEALVNADEAASSEPFPIVYCSMWMARGRGHASAFRRQRRDGSVRHRDGG